MKLIQRSLTGKDIKTYERVYTEHMTLDEKVKEAVDFVKETLKKYKNPYYVPYSGGKDSTAAGVIVRMVDPNALMIFGSHTLEWPETQKFIDEQIERGWNIIRAEAPLSFWELSERMGTVSRFRPWCCKILKLGPMSTAIKEHFGDKFVVGFLGIRKEEGGNRRRYGRINKNPYQSNAISAFPIYYWTEKDIWDFFKEYDIPYMPLYDREEVSRIGCMICPKTGPENEKTLDLLHPDIRKRHTQQLLDYARKYNLDDSWAHDQIWRGWKAVIGKDRVKNTLGWRSGKINADVNNPGTIIYKFKQDVYRNLERSFFVPFSKKIWPNLLRIKWNDANSAIEIQYLDYKKMKLFNAFEAQLAKAINCIHCTYCQAVCPHIEVTLPKMDKGEKTGRERETYSISDKCTGCLKCCFTKKCMKLMFSNETNIWESNEQLGRLKSIKNYKELFDEKSDWTERKAVLKEIGIETGDNIPVSDEEDV